MTPLPNQTLMAKPRRILLIHRYFWPDSPPYASMLRTIGEHLASDGYQVSVLSSQPSYKVEVDIPHRPYRESLGQMDVRRVRLLNEKSRAGWLRAINSLMFAWQIFWHLLRHGGQYDLVTCSTVPPVLTGLATSLGCRLRRCRFIYHAMDIWPEVAQHTGQMNAGVAYRLLRYLDTKSCLRADAVVCLSEDMRRTFIDRDSRLDPIVKVIGNFELPDYDNQTQSGCPDELKKAPGKFRVLFAGNLGRYQGLDSVVQAASLVKNDQVEFVLMGAGSERENLKQQARDLGCLETRVRFFPHQSVSVAKELMREANLSLVTLAPGVSSVAYPSKTLTLMAMGCPLGVMMEIESDLAKMVRKHELGFAVDCGDASGMADAITQLAQSPDQMTAIVQNVLQHAQKCALKEAILPQWSELIGDMFQSRERSNPVVTGANSTPERTRQAMKVVKP